MASYRPFHPPPPPPPHNQTSLPPPPQPLYSQNWNYSGYTAPPINPVPNQQQQYSSYPPPPPPESTYPPPPPRGQMYYPSSQHSQFNNQQPLQPPPPPSSPPSTSNHPPPPPPSQPPPPPPPPSSAPPVSNQAKELKQSDSKGPSKDLTGSKWREPQNAHHKVAPKQHAKPPMPGRTSSRVETEEERRVRKKREMEKQRQEEKHRQQLKESQNRILQKTHVLSSAIKPRGSISGSHIGERRATPFLSGERAENRLKKPTTFLCKLK